jgi:hypothetical protein
MKAFKKILVFTSAAVLIGCAYVAWAISQPTEKSQPFDIVKWQQAALLDTSNDPGCFRGGMALDLIERQALLERTGPEVVALLGAPPYANSGSWLYPVGQCGVHWEHFSLRVNFGSDAKVTHAGLAN